MTFQLTDHDHIPLNSLLKALSRPYFCQKIEP
jgi:hypothetical protein